MLLSHDSCFLCKYFLVFQYLPISTIFIQKTFLPIHFAFQQKQLSLYGLYSKIFL